MKITIAIEDFPTATFESTEASPMLAFDRARDHLREQAVGLKHDLDAARAVTAKAARITGLKAELAAAEATITLRPQPVTATGRVKGSR